MFQNISYQFLAPSDSDWKSGAYPDITYTTNLRHTHILS